ncbi:C4b-binding protein beta chain-like [Diadema antillarum]|uniref:C4b-binding protein beta chain-like n=1 Tax=Diadema antillarum TaxID=105358 RepID=UPI003A8C826A
MTNLMSDNLLLIDGVGSVDGQCSLPSSPCSHCSVDGHFDGEAPVPQGSYLLWTCDIGYVIDGSWEMVVWVCVQNNTWIGPQPICTEVTCSSPPVPAHGSIVEDDQQTYHQGDNISYVCDTGYSLSFPNSTGNLTCGTDGRWIPDNAPICRIDCPESYTEHDNVCFSTSTALSDWYGAVQACAVQGDILALPKNNNTHDHLKSMVNSGNYWIGVREGRDWKWASDGSYIERLFWNQGEPNGNHESCVELRKSDDGDHFWNDAACGEQNSFICEAGFLY